MNGVVELQIHLYVEVLYILFTMPSWFYHDQ